ncbi:hypothetical protein I41_36920 [Lacipirellula limnantheis]|uniref:Uncharacterized protein n=1 Tax=Lacipirellula limnantheis TaxID=2528024 RepID=A0A517U1J2_9BACT|nr:hypothetical protein I41_36920 [Lacipirellula limnantheis]
MLRLMASFYSGRHRIAFPRRRLECGRMKPIFTINLLIGFFMFFWGVMSDQRTLAVASNLADDLRTGSPKSQPIEYADLVRLLRREPQRGRGMGS